MEIELNRAKCTRLTFDSAVCFERAKDGEQEITGFDIDAYTGATVDRWWGKLAIEVSGIKAKKQMPIFRDHDHTKIVGFSTGTSKDGIFRVSGKFSQTTDHAREVMALAKEGFPWQASIGVQPKKIMSLEKGSKHTVNGQEISGPAEVWLESEVFETSFVPLGADGKTRVSVLAEEKPGAMPPTKTEESTMNFEQLKKEHPELVAAIEQGATAGMDEKMEAARQAGAVAERERIQAVLDQGKGLPGHDDLIARLAFDGKTTGPEAAVQVLAAEKVARAQGLDQFKAGANQAAPASTAGDGQTKTHDEQLKAKWDADQKMQAEFAGDFEAFKAYHSDVPGVRMK